MFLVLIEKNFQQLLKFQFFSLIRPDGSIDYVLLLIKPISLVLNFLLILLSEIPVLMILLLNPSNYLPIALTSAVAKVFETLLNSHFIKHRESNNLLSDHQHGFRKARSTGDLLSYLAHFWSSSLRNFEESIIALDISKSFDRVWHKALLVKLPAYCFTPSFCKLISSFLCNCFISVFIDSTTSASFPVSSAVIEGSVLSLTLFFS